MPIWCAPLLVYVLLWPPPVHTWLYIFLILHLSHLARSHDSDPCSPLILWYFLIVHDAVVACNADLMFPAAYVCLTLASAGTHWAVFWCRTYHHLARSHDSGPCSPLILRYALVVYDAVVACNADLMLPAAYICLTLASAGTHSLSLFATRTAPSPQLSTLSSYACMPYAYRCY